MNLSPKDAGVKIDKPKAKSKVKAKGKAKSQKNPKPKGPKPTKKPVGKAQPPRSMEKPTMAKRRRSLL